MIVLRPYRPKSELSASIASVENLCAALGISKLELEEALALAPNDRYEKKSTPKKDGSDRIIYKPHYLIRKIQRRINHRIFTDQNLIGYPDYLFGSIPNQIRPGNVVLHKDYIACAKIHCGSKSILSLDIQNFFDNIHIDHVASVFTDFLKYPDDVAEVLADICCLESHVVQGALTSSYIASLCMFDVEGTAVERLHRKNLRYTRLVDDITISSTVANYDFDFAISVVTGMLESKDLPVNHSKTKIQYISTTPLTVHGLRVGFNQPRFPSDEVRKLRSAVKNIETLAQEKNYRTSHAYRKDFNKCMGRVNKLGRIGHKQHSSLVARLKKVLPLPSPKDIERTMRIVARLEADVSKKDTFWYSKRFYIAHERLNILQRSYPKTALEMRVRLKKLRPMYEK